MRRQLLPSILMLVAMTAVTGFAYTFAVTGVGQLLFGDRADGSILERGGQPVGSELIGQGFTAPEYVHSRPSAAGDGYDPTISSGSNLGPLNPDLVASIEERIGAYRELNGLGPDDTAPVDAVTASGSGLDPHISVGNARLQAARVAEARGLTVDEVIALIDENTVNPTLGFLNEPSVNVLLLNLALEERETSP
ncbi:MAG TPA: K(+)-transporting ATPase subunit C [Acidimicrobiia bacterium]|nr:K(+)-transporting ATPase subunit C [Acidimicrobiia bacterium]